MLSNPTNWAHFDELEKSERILRNYFFQMSEGCELVVCREHNCKSHPSFPYKFKTANDIALHAIKLTESHAYHPLTCPGVSEISLNRLYPLLIFNFDTFIKEIIKENHRAIRKDEANVVQDTLSNVLAFPYILRSKEFLLTKEDLLLDDDLLDDFSCVLRTNPNLFKEMKFKKVVDYFMAYDIKNSFHHLRALILLLIFENFFNSENFMFDLVGIIWHILELPGMTQKIFFNHLGHLPKTIRIILNVIQSNLTLFIFNEPSIEFTEFPFDAITMFLTKLRRSSPYPFSSQLFANNEYSQIVDIDMLYRNRENFLFRNPSILSLNVKLELFRKDSVNKQSDEASAVFSRQMNDMDDSEFDQNSDNDGKYDLILNLGVRRSNLIEDTMEAFQQFDDNQLFKKLSVTFVDEEGIDSGGVSREYFHLLIGQIFSPDFGMFVLVKDNAYWFNKADIGITSTYFQLFGTIVALAVYNGVILPIRFPRLFYKKMLRKRITMCDYEEFDPDAFKSLQKLLEMKQNGEDVSDLCLYFSVSFDKLGKVEEVPLIKGGEKVTVTNENVEHYVKLYMKWQTIYSVETQFDAFEKGFMKLFTREIFNLFAEDELDIMVSGEEIFDWDDLKKGIMYSDGYKQESRAVKWFWEVFDEFSNDMKIKFLIFTTGSCRAPIGGLENIGITIQMVYDGSMLPVSHTCSLVFGLPNYVSKDEMRQKVTTALMQTEGFGLI